MHGLHDVELDEGARAHAVEEGDDTGAVAGGQLGQNRLDEPPGDLAGGDDLLAAAAGLAVDADTDLHLVVRQVEGRQIGRASCRERV